jgi:preprotein translocase subunit SecA
MLTAWRNLAGFGAERRRRVLVQRIIAGCERLEAEPESALRRMSQELAWRVGGAAISDDAIVEGFALVREAARRVHGQPHFPTQLAAGVVLARGGLAEMQTGEGKTLAALLPTFLHALAGRGCHVVTANDYLAQRDARFAGAAFETLGLRVGCVTNDILYEERGPQYACDVTYGAAREFGFDFLRDRLSQEGGVAGRQRPRYFALVDEADSVLIDEARTPLVIALGAEPGDQEVEFLEWCSRVAASLDAPRDLSVDRSQRCVRLTHQGRRRVVDSGRRPTWDGAAVDRAFHQIEQAGAAQLLLQRDRDYVVSDGRVEIVDPATGRVSAGRKWRNGLQQAVEIKERLKPTADTAVAARISIQAYFRGYPHLAGLTGTARSCAAELQRVYGLPVTAIPTRNPCVRTAEPPRVFATRGAKLEAVAAEVARRLSRGQAVLVGTPSVEASEELSAALHRHGLAHAVLNCLRHAQEAEIVAMAGQPGRVTVATNMAGRGTDIVVNPAVRAAGGLHVIATEMHASPRIDRQLVGRTARQGDPGSCQLFLSLDDELFAGWENPAIRRARRRAGRSPRAELPRFWVRYFHAAQQQQAAAHRRERQSLLRHEQERERSYRELGLDPLLDGVE